MRRLLQAGVLVAPALAGAAALQEAESQRQDSIPSAFITLRLPESDEAALGQDLVFRFDIHESSDPCGYGNVAINGQTLRQGGNGSFALDENRIVDAAWNLTCLDGDHVPQEQLLSLNVASVNGQHVDDVGFTLRFQQIAPVWISDVQGSVSMTRVHSVNQAQPGCDDQELDVEAEMAELDSLRWQVAELEQQIFAKERRLADALGWHQPPRPPMIQECDSLKCVLGAVFHKVKGAAWSIYPEDFPGFRHHRGPPGPNHFKHPHGPSSSGPEGRHNHTKNGTHPHHPPPFAHPPPFCQCPPPPPPGHHGPPSHGPPPPPPPPPAGAWPPPPPGAFPPPPPPLHGGPPPPPHAAYPPPPGGFPNRPPPPGSWPQAPPAGHPQGPPHGPPHGHPEGPGSMHGHHGIESSPFPHHPADHHGSEPKPHHMPPPAGVHDPWEEDQEEVVPEMKAEGAPKDTHADGEEPSEAELRRDFENGPHKGAHPPHMHDGPGSFDGAAPPMPPPPPPPFGEDGMHPPPPPPPPPPFDGHDGSMPPPPPPPPPPHHGGPPRPHAPVFVHIASAISSLILLGVFISVLYQRYVRRNSVIYLSAHRRRSYSNAPWYKKLCFGPDYAGIAEEEKEAMLRDCDSDCASVEGGDDQDVVTRDISQFRVAADVVGEMAAAEEGRMMMTPPAHSRHSSSHSEFGHMQVPHNMVQVPQFHPHPHHHHQPQYMPTNAIPVPMMNTVPMPISAEAAAMFPDLHQDDDDDELPAYQEANRRHNGDDDVSELAASLAADGYRPGCSGSYTPSESGSLGASDILGDTKN